ncbi:MAG: hypothetical protein MI892_25025 [Desulfobacterales bacterium]|nr:hypothetical protein [Desulfobacterales bacterium]
MDSLGAAAIVTGGIKMADKVAPGIVSVKDDITKVYDDLFKKKTMGPIKSADEGFDSFRALKKHLGSGGEGNHWHHIVEQSQIKKSGFSANSIQNTGNIIAVDKAIHAKITGYYGSIQPFSDGMKVRDWLAGQSFEEQYKFGVDVLKNFKVID